MGKRCYLCGATILTGEVCFLFGARRICSDCADGVTAEDLMHITGTCGARAMLAELGFEKDVVY